jgi:hypothetical protein
MYDFYTVRIETADGISSAHVRKVRSIESDPIDLEPENSKHSMAAKLLFKIGLRLFRQTQHKLKFALIQKIVSGRQTGADPERYCLKETPERSYRQRT